MQCLSQDEYEEVHTFFANFMQSLGEQLKLRQQVIATAMMYFKRFYARNSLKGIDPLLMAPTCTYLESKVAEFGVISNNRFNSACNTVTRKMFSYAFRSEQFPHRMN